MVMICPYCDSEINEKQMEAEDGCCPECGALITAGNVLNEDDDDYYDDEDEFGDDEFDDEDEFGDLDDFEDDFGDGFEDDFDDEPKSRRRH